MRYRGKDIELIGEKMVFGKRTAWIRLVEDNSFLQVLWDDIVFDDEHHQDISHIRYIALATRIKEEIAQKRILAPYESSLIPLPHQILILEKLMKAPQTRFLLADEVGMGKTIEAGLALKELKLRGEIKRTLLIVPKSAMLQWQSEMQQHFKEQFHIYDSQLINSMASMFSQIEAEEELNFWRQHNQIIVSTDALKPLEHRQGWSQDKIDTYNKYRIEAVVNADFDLVIIDEAHKMGGSTAQVSRYQLAETLSNAVPRILLLSATPHRGKSDHFRRVLQLLDADTFMGDDMPSVKEIEPFVMRTEKRFAVDYNGQKLFNERKTIKLLIPLESERHHLQQQLYAHLTEYVRTSFNKAKQNRNTALALVMTMLQKIASSSTAAIHSALSTRLYRLQNGLEESVEDYDPEYDISDFDGFQPSDYSVAYTSDDRTEEEVLQDLVEEARVCMEQEQDAKAEALIRTIAQQRMEQGDSQMKVLVFTEFRATQQYLEKELTAKGLVCATINGSMGLETRQNALRFFKDQADVMISTDAAGESLNMQFCYVIVNYDLPWNPMAIEQRIGRVDRIGQKHTVKALNMLTSNSIDARVYGIIVEKLDTILNELGIDKTSDVLDSTIEQDRINRIYLQSLLDPRRMEFVGDSWLFEIKKKLREYKATEGILPSISKEEIDNKLAADVKYSPLPVWLEQLMDIYAVSRGGKVEKSLMGVSTYQYDGMKINVVFDAEHAMENPAAEQITLQHDLVSRMLDRIESESQQTMPVIRSTGGKATPGVFSLWRVSAKNPAESKVTYVALFTADNGRNYAAYANQIWNKLVESNDAYAYVGESELPVENETDMGLLYEVFHRMEVEILQTLQKKSDARLKALDFQRQRAERIGIMNIRTGRIRKIDGERQEYLDNMRRTQSVVPDVKNIIKVRIDG
jgi:superfamily II DNA or RNA helicase